MSDSGKEKPPVCVNLWQDETLSPELQLCPAHQRKRADPLARPYDAPRPQCYLMRSIFCWKDLFVG